MPRSIYGLIEPELLWYTFFLNTIEGICFEINPCDICVANMMIGVIQCTIAWYVDDKTLSHINLALISDIINKVKEHFGDLFFLIGNKNIFLDMHIDIKDNIIQFDMVEKFE